MPVPLGRWPSIPAVREIPSGELVISRAQKRVHMTTEAFAVAIIVPWMLSLAFRKNPRITRLDKFAALFVAAGTLVVDGGLLLQFSKRRKTKDGAVAGRLRDPDVIDTTAVEVA